MIYLDTHVLVRLYLGDIDKLSALARRAIEREDDLVVSAATILELEFLHEIGRLQPPATKVATALAQEVNLRICDLPLRRIVEFALKEGWGRDPFDRLIVANAKANNAPLVSKDERIRQHYPRTVW